MAKNNYELPDTDHFVLHVDGYSEPEKFITVKRTTTVLDLITSFELVGRRIKFLEFEAI